jgi:putative thioredoxin
MSTTSPHTINVQAADFEREVIERSKEVPVVVDFWAEWCGPCRTLGPVLERLAVEYAGRFVLAKADVDQMPGIAAQFGASAIPAVFALRDGRIVDGFVGALPEPQIRTFLDGILPGPAELLAREAAQLSASDPDAAEAKYREAIAQAGARDAAPKIGLARLLLDRGRADEARAILDDLETRGYLEPEAERIKAELTLRQAAPATGSLDAARAEAAAHPDDLAARLRLAEALAAAGQHAEALEIALDLVERDRHGVGEEARKLMLAVFQVLPPDSPLVTDFRRRLSFVL